MDIMKTNKVRLMCMASVFATLVFVVTAYLHIPTNNGYIHVGDGLIYLAACILPWPYAIAVGAGGALLADCLTGYAVWAPGSAVIKAVTTLFFSRMVFVRSICATVIPYSSKRLSYSSYFLSSRVFSP